MQKITNETELLQASMGGSREAFGAIVEQYQALICGITYSTTGNLSKSEELAQETFIRAWKGLGQLKDLGSFRAWLSTIARNLARKSIRQRKRDATETALPLKEANQIQSFEPGPVEKVISKEQQEVVWWALERIPEKYREPIVLFYRQKQSVNQTATDLGLSEDVVKQRLSRGRKLLKAEIAAVVADVLGQTGPGKTFSVAVVASLPALTAQTATAAAVGMAAKGAPAVKTTFLSGISGAVLGPLLGLLGGIFGTWMSIKNTKSARERRFMVIMGIIGWLVLLLLIAVPLVLSVIGVIPKWACWPFFGLFFVLLIPSIAWGNARQRQIQIEEGTYIEPVFRPMKLTKGNVYGAFGGSIFGSVCWIFVIAFITKDWLTALSVLISVLILFFVSTTKCLREPVKYWRIVIIDMVVIALLTFVVVNLRWERWKELYGDGSFGFDYPLWVINIILLAVFGALTSLFIFRARDKRRFRDIQPNGEEKRQQKEHDVSDNQNR
ncbi:MAG: sigma-70 family RNA polymerase sigma factor [Phycisphaerae bacterium]|nr:sigma-70 family RNA polymerase sigma factor [Phycisphaerae bacterium]NIP54334.1 sigma-70 family RNA polymerase sigma factor [Phycisphaerae bacterium]NIS53201.1 sigma-70 family RNA polymerase sigma factor [Phycisphaerae bacterium]NIU10687.1 sigma-70 family RNA polymerase sigma factor [Phycisphaerae bacterium]NIU58455.1 sigma-70 family RNA polymerase sigma factor [Phycisphaerae bacterium]